MPSIRSAAVSRAVDAARLDALARAGTGSPRATCAAAPALLALLGGALLLALGPAADARLLVVPWREALEAAALASARLLAALLLPCHAAVVPRSTPSHRRLRSPSGRRASRCASYAVDHRVRRFGRIVGQQHQVHVARRDLPLAEHARLQPAHEPGPVVAAEQDHRELVDLPRLDQRQRLEQLVERAEAAGEDDERDSST